MHKHLTPALADYAVGIKPGPIGYRRNGSPIFPIAGASPEGDGDGGGDGSGAQASNSGAEDFTPIETPEQMQQFLRDRDLVVSARVQRERDRHAAETRELREKASKYDEGLEAAKTEQERAVEAAKAEGRTEALSTANARLVQSEARALAAEAKFRNPTLAVRAVDLSGVTVSDDGTPDAEAIKAKLTELSTAEPYLIDDVAATRPKPDRGQGQQQGQAEKSVSAGRDMYQSKTKTNA